MGRIKAGVARLKFRCITTNAAVLFIRSNEKFMGQCIQ
jgi:hypothetical protein